MFKKNIGIPIIAFLFLTVKQFIFNSDIHWVDNIIFSVLLFLIYPIGKWINKPYDWSKRKKER
ncbi:hypothetical protein DTX80_11920 [Bacilli bacterium]|uniref:Uncharacterized protein n=1 Tax=Oceanobacillus caeni TaxID=405946 RepID=A0ABR5MGU2_9BACI|nr:MULTISPECIES: hypothetical protein [Bacillaceae]KKE78314.1 hypothetical protein WH51_13465 [Bacilli bacterium VT-13-104]RCO05391.1 hypothetical protein DTX80_11920 [Bacilli bacterium]KPH72123.1 hypothetical protein AFL42_13975 [Oceanobacillus caeni]MBU8790844.1 hypothetical protein [Oceanobacillus caeni]RCO10392.1 hypothetical protein DTX79_04915 [Bacilli bacterium]